MLCVPRATAQEGAQPDQEGPAPATCTSSPAQCLLQLGPQAQDAQVLGNSSFSKAEQSTEIRLRPQAQLQSFHFRGDSRSLIREVGAAYGIEVILDDSISGRPVRMDLQNVAFEAARRIVSQLTKTFWSPISETQVLVSAESTESRTRFERFSLRTFYIRGASPQELVDLVNVLRTVLDVRMVSSQPTQGTILVRAPTSVLDQVQLLLENLDDQRPEVMLDIQAFEVDDSNLRLIGLDVPGQFRIFNVATELRAILQNPGAQGLLDQLLAGRTLDPAALAAAAALLAQLQDPNSILGKPILTVGGGKARTGIVVPSLGFKFQSNHAVINNMDHITLRASQGNAATFRSGTRFPVLTQSFGTQLNPALLQQLGQSAQTQANVIPGFAYEDLGITLKATPQIHGTTDVTLELELTIKALGTGSLNGIPVISNREYKGTVGMLNGESAVVTGSMSEQETKSASGLPALAQIPLLKNATSNNSTESSTNQLIVVLTPHIIRSASHEGGSSRIIVMN